MQISSSDKLFTENTSIVADEPDRSDRGTGSWYEVRHASEQGSVKGTHLWYAKLDRGSRSTLVWIDDPGSIEWNVVRHPNTFGLMSNIIT
jgi:hypothetical protein